jgi:hypothetical protein
MPAIGMNFQDADKVGELTGLCLSHRMLSNVPTQLSQLWSTVSSGSLMEREPLGHE